MALPEHSYPLLPQQRQKGSPPEEETNCCCRGVTWTTAIGFVFFTFNCAVAVYNSQDYGFAVCSFFELLALLACLKHYEKAEPGSEIRDRQKVYAGLLTTALAFLFSYQVSTIVPPAVAVAVCLLAFGTVARVIYFL